MWVDIGWTRTQVADELEASTAAHGVLKQQWHVAMTAMNRRDEALQVCGAVHWRGTLPLTTALYGLRVFRNLKWSV
mgnify:CR=1 FL=1